MKNYNLQNLNGRWKSEGGEEYLTLEIELEGNIKLSNLDQMEGLLSPCRPYYSEKENDWILADDENLRIELYLLHDTNSVCLNLNTKKGGEQKKVNFKKQE